MPVPISTVWLLAALLSFPSVAHSMDVDPTNDFCSLSAHISRTPATEMFSRGVH